MTHHKKTANMRMGTLCSTDWCYGIQLMFPFYIPFLHSGFQSTPELLEVFQTEFSLRLFWGSKGAQAERGERYKKFERILTVLSQKLEWAHGRSIPPTPCQASWNARHGWQRWLVSRKEESYPSVRKRCWLGWNLKAFQGMNEQEELLCGRHSC